MNFRDVRTGFRWIPYDGQTDSDVTNIFVKDFPVRRLNGESDILYIGQTEQTIRDRYRQETSVNNSPKNTQLTNIRTTHVFKRLGIDHCKCYFTKEHDMELPGEEKIEFLNKLRTWHKTFYLSKSRGNAADTVTVPLEKYLLIKYADDHLELPPMNNSF